MQEEAGLLSLLNQAKLSLPASNLRTRREFITPLVEEAIVDEAVSTPDPASPFAETLKGASPIKSVKGCRRFELLWSRYVAYLVTEERVGSGGSDEDEVYTGNLLRVYTKS